MKWVGVDIPWVGGQNPIGRGVKIPWVGARNTMDRGFKIPWVELQLSIYCYIAMQNFDSNWNFLLIFIQSYTCSKHYYMY